MSACPQRADGGVTCEVVAVSMDKLARESAILLLAPHMVRPLSHPKLVSEPPRLRIQQERRWFSNRA
jgi:hypothetical protein